ncbi:MAG: acyloxyacyl hydrolase [Simkaniaceae bacterium]|nr:acyloxyacyl hydrolase [Simkaniaceae bacterium]
MLGRSRHLLIPLLIGLPLLSCRDSYADTPDRQGLLLIGGGLFDLIRTSDTPLFTLEYRYRPSIRFNPHVSLSHLIGAMVTSSPSGYFCGGMAFDFSFGRRIFLSPSFAPGIYVRGKGKDLGFPIAFRSAIRFSYRFSSGIGLGAMFYHISNASLGYTNPGAECLIFFVSIPIN